MVIVDPGVKVDPAYPVCAEGLARDAFCRLPDGQHFVGPVWPGDCYFPDFADPEVRVWWGGLYGRLLETGVAGVWNDMNEPAIFPAATMPDSVQHRAEGAAGRVAHRTLHNAYGQLMAQACAEGLRRLRPDERPFVISRAGYAGIQRHALTWTGDNVSTWDHLRLTIPMILNLGLSGQPFAGPDTGGFSGDADGELVTRWTQLGAFLPFFRNHSALGTRSQEPYVFGEPFESICRRYIELRYRLLPAIYTAFWQAAERGMPVARPLALAFPADRRTASLDDEYLFGDALLVAPILERGARGRGVYLPQGAWYDFWSGARLAGPGDVPAHAPLETLPLYARAGSVVPLGPVMQYTDQLVPRTLDLHIFPGDGESWLYEDDGHTLAHVRGEARVTSFELEAGPDRLILTWRSQGSYDPGYRGYDLLLRGMPVDRRIEVLVDGLHVEAGPRDAEWSAMRVAAGMFHRAEICW